MFLPAFIINYQRNSWKKPALPNNTLWKRHYFFFKLLKNIPEVYFLCEVFVVMGVQRFVDSRMRKRCHHLKVSQPKVSIATDSQHNLSPCLKNTKNYKKHKRMQWPTLYWKERKVSRHFFYSSVWEFCISNEEKEIIYQTFFLQPGFVFTFIQMGMSTGLNFN